MLGKIKKAADIISSPFLFTVVTMLYLPINMIAVVNVLQITRYILALLCVWGAFVLARVYLFSGKKPYTKQGLALIAFLAVCLITEVINYKYGGFSQLEKLYFTALGLLILFTQFGISEKERRNELYVISHVVPVITTVAFIVSIVMYLTIFVRELEVRSGAIIHVGFAENRLIGVFTSSNVGGTYAIFSIVLCVIAYILRKKEDKLTTAFKVIYGIQVAISIIFISLTLSKGTYVNLFFLIAVVGIMLPAKKFNFLLIVKRAVCIALTCTTLFAATLGIQKAMAWGMVRINIGSIGDYTGDSAYDEIIRRAQLGWDGRVEADRTDIDFANKRVEIWTGTLHMLKGKNLFTGVNNSVSYLDANEAALNLNEQDTYFIHWSDSNTHNGYLQVLMQSGIFALLIILGFLIFKILELFIGLIKQLGKPESSADNKYETVLCVILFALPLMILENNAYESNFVLMGTNYFQAMFWYTLGLCGYVLDKLKKGEKLW